jgi:hypothetical protein
MMIKNKVNIFTHKRFALSAHNVPAFRNTAAEIQRTRWILKSQP